MKNDEAVARVKETLDEAKGIAKSSLNTTDSLVIVHIGLMLFEERRKNKGKKFLPGNSTTPLRSDPVQEARKTPRKPLMAASTPVSKKAPARKH